VGPFSPGLPIRCTGTGFALGHTISPLPGLQKAFRHERDFVKELLTQDTRRCYQNLLYPIAKGIHDPQSVDKEGESGGGAPIHRGAPGRRRLLPADVGVGLALPLSGAAKMRGRQAVPLQSCGVIEGLGPTKQAAGPSRGRCPSADGHSKAPTGLHLWRRLEWVGKQASALLQGP